MLEFFREVTASPAEDLMVVAGLLTAADGATKIAGLVAAHIGAPEAGAAAMQSLRKLGTPIADLLGPLPYTTLNSLLDDAFPRGARSYWKSHFLDGLSDGAIDALLKTASRLPSPQARSSSSTSMAPRRRVAPTATAYALRSPGLQRPAWRPMARRRGLRRRHPMVPRWLPGDPAARRQAALSELHE